MMQIKLVDQAPKCNLSLDNFVNKYSSELINTFPKVTINYFDRDLFQVYNFVRSYGLYLTFINPKFDDNMVYYEIVGLKYPKYRIKINNSNKDYDFFNSLFINDNLINEFNNKAFILHIGQLDNYMTNKSFLIDGNALVRKNKLIVVSGD